MKNKIKKILLTIICILILPIVVKADMGAPSSYQYDVVIIDKEGTSLVDWNMKEITKIPYDTTVTVLYEYSMNGELYADIEYNGKYGYVKLSDTQPLTGELDYSKLEKNTYNKKYYTIKETDMYKGPSLVYGKIEDTTIPKGEELTYTYSTFDEAAPLWILVKYNGVEGWVYSYSYLEMSPYENLECTVVLMAKKDSKLLVATDDAVLLKEAKEKSDETGKLSKDKVYEYKYYTNPYPKTTAYYIETKEASGWLLNYGYNGPGEDTIVIYNKRDILTLVDDLKVYANYDSEEPVKGVTIPKYTELTSTYEFSVKCDYDKGECNTATQVIYNGKEYWLLDQYYFSANSENVSEITYSDSPIKLTLKKDAQIYEEAFYTDTKTDTKIPEGTELKVKFYDYDWATNEKWYFVEYDGVKGWIKNENHDEEEITEDIEEDEYPEEDEEKETSDEKENDEEREGLTPKQVGIICLGGAVVLALVAIVTIKLINKKKAKKEEVKTVEELPKEEIVEQLEENKVEETNKEKKKNKKGE